MKLTKLRCDQFVHKWFGFCERCAHQLFQYIGRTIASESLVLLSLCCCAKVNRTWGLGLTACLFWTGSDVFLSTTSIMHLCAIAIHRHLGIAYPLRMRRGAQNRRHVLCLLLPAWTVSAAVSASLVVQGAMDRHSVLVPQDGNEAKLACGIYDHTFAIYSSMLSFFVPLAVMVAVDVRSVQILHTSRRRDIFAGSMSLSSAANPSRDVSS